MSSHMLNMIPTVVEITLHIHSNLQIQMAKLKILA